MVLENYAALRVGNAIKLSELPQLESMHTKETHLFVIQAI